MEHVILLLWTTPAAHLRGAGATTGSLSTRGGGSSVPSPDPLVRTHCSRVRAFAGGLRPHAAAAVPTRIARAAAPAVFRGLAGTWLFANELWDWVRIDHPFFSQDLKFLTYWVRARTKTVTVARVLADGVRGPRAELDRDDALLCEHVREPVLDRQQQ